MLLLKALTYITVFIHWHDLKGIDKIHEHTYEMISHSSNLHQILQVIMSEDFPAARIQATVHYFGNLFP